MKNQYFADRRDFVKYELLLDLVELLPASHKLTFIPMLTEADGTIEGGVTHYELGNRRPHLFRFLRGVLNSGRRELLQLHTFMQDNEVAFYLYSDREYFQHNRRKQYLDDVPNEKLDSAVVFFDPDIGLETGSVSYMRRNGFEKYLFYNDIRSVVDRATNDAIIVLYQHLQYNKKKVLADLTTRCSRLVAVLGLTSIGYTKDRDVAFLAFSKSQSLHCQVLALMERHSHVHGMEFGVLPV